MKKKITFILCFAFLSTLFGQWAELGSPIDASNNFEEFGTVTEMSGDGTVIACGAPQKRLGNDRPGAVRVYKYLNGSWFQIGNELCGNNSDRFGSAISLSEDGLTLGLGMRSHRDARVGSNSGMALVFRWNGVAWAQLGDTIKGTQVSENLGYSVSLSSDGNTFVCASPFFDSNSFNNNGKLQAFTWNGTTWLAKGSPIEGLNNDRLSNYSLHLSGDGNNLICNGAGFGRVYQFNSGSWFNKGSDFTDTPLNNEFGRISHINFDGNTVALTDTRANANIGLVRVFDWNGFGWGQRGGDINGIIEPNLNLPDQGEYFGAKVLLSDDGNTFITQTGLAFRSTKVRVFEWNNGAEEWSQRGEDLISPKELGTFSTNFYAYNGLGFSGDGFRIVVGMKEYPTVTGQGQIRMYEYNTATGILSSSLNKDNISVFPVPAENVLSIETEINGEYKIFTPEGQLMLGGEKNTATNFVDISSLKSGNYILKINETVTKFSKQ